MTNALNQKLGSKSYRNIFSPSYQQLFKRNQECSYLSDILDSAQEGSVHMWVNGEKYIFSDYVVKGGLELCSHLGKLIEIIKQIYKTCSDDSFDYSVIEKANE